MSQLIGFARPRFRCVGKVLLVLIVNFALALADDLVPSVNLS